MREVIIYMENTSSEEKENNKSLNFITSDGGPFSFINSISSIHRIFSVIIYTRFLRIYFFLIIFGYNHKPEFGLFRVRVSLICHNVSRPTFLLDMIINYKI